MRLGSLKVDFMPDDERILGYSNRWYSEAFASAHPYRLTEAITIKLLTPPYFIATKLEAYLGRGNDDRQGSHDMEDILNLFDGRDDIVEVIAEEKKGVRNYIARQIGLILLNNDFGYAVQAATRGDTDREDLIYERLERVRDLVSG